VARIRTIKPGFFKNEELAELSFPSRLLFIGLWTQADKEGRLEDRPKRLKAEIFPYDSVNTDELLSKLQSAGFIVRYTVEDAELGEMKLIQVNNFCKHQRFTGSEADSESEYPAPSKEGNTLETFGNTLETPRTTGKEGKGREGKGKEEGFPDVVFPFPSDEFKNAWMLWKQFKLDEHKFKYKSTLSEQAALKDLSEISGANENIAIKIIGKSMAKGWQGLFPLKEEKNAEQQQFAGLSKKQQLIADSISKARGYNPGR
jgi:hypothetical protein